MGKRSYPYNKVKYGRSYDKDEICALLDTHPQTVQGWINKQGLKTIDHKKPSLVYGWDLIEFLKKYNNANKCPTEFHEMHCFKCANARPFFQNRIAVEQKLNGLMVKAICRTCKKPMNQNYKLTDFPRLKRTFTVVDVSELYDCEKPSVKTHIYDHTNLTQCESLQGVLPL
jgi:hypothetical protein